MMPTPPWLLPGDRWKGFGYAAVTTLVYGAGIAVFPGDPLGRLLSRISLGLIASSWGIAVVQCGLACWILKRQGEQPS